MKQVLVLVLAATVAACAMRPQPALERLPGEPSGPPPSPPPTLEAEDVAFLDRLTWGANGDAARELHALGRAAWLERQLKAPPSDDLPPAAATQVAALTITQRPLVELAAEMSERFIGSVNQMDDAKRIEQRRAFQQELTKLARETAQRHVLRALYSPWQLRE